MKDVWMDSLKNDIRNVILDEYREIKGALRNESLWSSGYEACPDSGSDQNPHEENIKELRAYLKDLEAYAKQCGVSITDD